MAIHTEGPWLVADYDIPPRYLHALPPMVLIRSAGPRGFWVALAVMDSGDGFPTNPAERDANALLIAGAPKLLAALSDLERAAQAHLDATDGSERQYLIEECEKARAAIANATK